ncbi:MAG: alanine dehydrogenase [Acidimicrobiia bacterium]|nr:alanine dehydrogenase [Acidimicrobiia bacterium]
MQIGVPREIKKDEYRVAVTPAGAHELAQHGHDVVVEEGAGVGSSFSDDEYVRAGARIVDADTAWSSELVCKVKEPQHAEFAYLDGCGALFTYLHLAAYPEVAEALRERGTTSIAYETVQTDDGELPLLAPMSEVAGRMATQVGAHFLEKAHGGRGVLLGGVPGVRPANVVVIGGGNVGTEAARVAVGMGAHVTIFDVSPRRLRELDLYFGHEAIVLMSTRYDVADALADADLVIGAVLIPGGRAPSVVRREHLPSMHDGSVLVDVAIDQGGCFETSRETSHSDPTYVIDGVVHYAVGNIPGAVPRTSTTALSNSTFPYLLRMADLGVDGAMELHPELARGLNTRDGQVVHAGVAAALA